MTGIGCGRFYGFRKMQGIARHTVQILASPAVENYVKGKVVPLQARCGPEGG